MVNRVVISIQPTGLVYQVVSLVEWPIFAFTRKSIKRLTFTGYE